MTTALDSDSGQTRWIAVGLVLSLGLHVAVAGGISRIPERARDAAQWVRMAVNEVQPAPEPPPPPPPEPPKPKKAETVEFQPKTDVAPPPPAPPTPRPVQGLDNNSFVKNGGTGLQVRNGNTVATRPTEDRLQPGDGPTVVVPYASVTNPPKIRYKPTLVVPPSIKDRKIEGRVELLLTVDETGKVSALEVVEPLDPEADEACKTALLQSRWKPGDKDGAPVITRNVPYSCKFEMTLD